jgi:hypothetical protein
MYSEFVRVCEQLNLYDACMLAMRARLLLPPSHGGVLTGHVGSP